MRLTKKQILSLIFFLIVLFALPLAIFLTQKRQDIRPRALQGKANLLMSSDKNSAKIGETINVLVSLQLTQPSLKISGADFMILYDKNKLDVVNIKPYIMTINGKPASAFTDAPVVTSGGRYDDTFNYLRVVEIAKMPDNSLASGTVTLGWITFKSIGEGSAVVKFPENNKYLEIVGTGVYVPPTKGPTCVPRPSCLDNPPYCKLDIPNVCPPPRPTCTPEPPCLYASPPCAVAPLPPGGWSCPRISITPTPSRGPTPTGPTRTPTPIRTPTPTVRPSPSVTPTGPYLGVSSSTVYPGINVLTVTWGNISPTTNKDWIGLYRREQNNRNYLIWQYTGGAPSGSLNFRYNFEINNIYEFRLLANDGYNLLARSGTITVVPRPSPTPTRPPTPTGPTRTPTPRPPTITSGGPSLTPVPPTVTPRPPTATSTPAACDQVRTLTVGWGTYDPDSNNWGGLNERWYKRGNDWRYKYEKNSITYVRAWDGNPGLTQGGKNPRRDTLLLQVAGSCN